MNFIEKNLVKILIVISLLFWGSLALWVYHDVHKQSFGQSVPNVPAQFETALAIPQATTDTTATLANSYPLPGTVCLTIDSNAPLSEYECGTASTTNPTLITNLTRGIDTSYGTTSVASLIQYHKTGADVRVTDFPSIQQYANIFNGIQGITNPILYSGVATSTLQTNLNYLASVGYVNSVAVSGAANASLSQNGLVQQATALQLAGSINVGSTGAILFAPGGLFASSSSSTTLVPVTQTNGKLNPNFIDLTGTYTWTGVNTFSNSVTLSGPTTTLSGIFSVASTTASSTYGFGFTHIQTFTASTTWSKPLNVNKVWVRLVGGGATPAGTNYSGGGGGGGYCEKIADVSATSSISVIVGLAGQTSSFGNFCSASGGSNTSGSGSSGIGGGAGGVGSGGDINISGQAGGNTNSAAGPVGSCGAGGGSVLGGGGAGSWNGGSASCSGSNGGNYGGGGGGCLGSSCTGGTGAPGVVIVEW